MGQKLCECSCGEYVKGVKSKFLPGHWLKAKGQKGAQNHFYGKTHTDESKKLIAEAEIGFHHSEETKQLMSEQHLGKSHKMSEEGLKNIRIAVAAGNRNPKNIEKRARHMAHKKYKHIAPNGSITKMRSRWEVRYAHYLDSQNYVWEYEPKGFRTSLGLYLPDFYIVDLDEWHEVKGYMYRKAQEKIDAFRIEYPNEKFVLISEEIFYEIMNRQERDKVRIGCDF